MRGRLASSMRSDNGTILVRAERKIAELFKVTSPQFQEMQKFVNNFGIIWSFSPTYEPHFGGIWKAAVKSFKFHKREFWGSPSKL